MSLIITISRRYCTGTSIISEALSKKLNIPVYGKDYICRHANHPDDIEEQHEIIKELAKNSCIIIGRGASEVLKNTDNVVNIFIYANKEDRIKRAMEKEHISKDEAARRVKEVDSERIAFYEKYTGKFWGDMDNYDILLDSSKYGIENCANIIYKYLQQEGLIY